MTIDDEIQLMPATSGQGSVVPEGRWTLHLVRLEKAPPSPFKPEDGPRIKWFFNLYAEMVDGLPKGTLFTFNGSTYEFWRTTSTKNSPRAFARQYAEALMGRKLGDNEVPRLSSLEGLKMSALISYDENPDDPEKPLLKMTGLKHIPGQAAAPVQTTAKPAPNQVSADPTDAEVERALLVTTLEKRVARLKKFDATAGEAAQSAVDQSDLSDAPLSEIKALIEQVETAISAALDD